MKTIRLHYHFPFILIFISQIFAIIFNFRILELITKPTILIYITLFFINFANENHPIFNWTITAFILSCIGDILLLFTNNDEWFFILGLLSFLLSHICYTYIFSIRNKRVSSSKLYYSIITFAIAGLAFYILLYQHLNSSLKPAVFIYIAAISSMIIFALKRKGGVSSFSFYYVMIGGFLFLISDSVLAINKFWIEINNSDIFIMSTYMIAQYLIMLGLRQQTIEKVIEP